MGHRFHGAVESRYARGDLLDERRELLTAWARYCSGQDAIEDEIKRSSSSGAHNERAERYCQGARRTETPRAFQGTA